MTQLRLNPDLFVVNPIDATLTADTSQANLLNPVTFTYRTVTLTSQGEPVATGGTVTFHDAPTSSGW